MQLPRHDMSKISLAVRKQLSIRSLAVVMADSAVGGSDAAVPSRQQGMSPTLPILDGEDRGPDYHRDDVERRRELIDVQGQQHSNVLHNGVSGGHDIQPPIVIGRS